MKKRTLFWMLILVAMIGVAVVLATGAMASSPAAIGAEGASAEANTAEQPAPVSERFTWTADLPPLTEEQQAQLEYGLENSDLPGPSRDKARQPAPSGPMSGPETTLGADLEAASAERRMEPGADSDAVVFRNRSFGGAIPGGYKSNVMESSVGTGGRYVFFTGNWFGARSIDGGQSWSYVSSFSGFSDFCCDQITLYDESRNRYFWLRMGVPDGNGENVFKLGVSSNGGSSFCTYTTAPTGVNSGWTNNWWDYPHIQLGADYLYMAWNMFNQGGSWTRTVMLRWPLDALADCAGFSYNYYYQSDWFTFVPVQGAYHTMYFASNWPVASPYNRLRIYRWHEDSTGISYWDKTVTAWTLTGRGDAHCPAGETTSNWAGRYDDRLLTGARYTIYNDGIAEDRIPGRKVIAWWWNVGEGGGFVQPYIDAAAFYEDTIGQLSGYLGRPYIYSSAYCFAYPSITPNKRQDLGAVFNWARSPYWEPKVAFALADDYATAPPGWILYNVRSSLARPSDDKWGDYNTVREFEPTQKVWVAASHFIPTYNDCSNCSVPVYFVFGRERDRASFNRWQTK